MKYYAVKNGRKNGIFETWDECKRQVDGFSGAEYKSFTKKEDALTYLGIGGQEAFDFMDEGKIKAYVDGSYNIETCEFSFGAVLLSGGEEKTFSQKFADPELAEMRNVAGEIKGAEFIMRYSVENGIRDIEIYYDYEGIASWAEGKWKTNKDGTIAYKKAYDELSRYVNVTFCKVKGHSGDKYNDMADRLAKDALGIK